MRPIIKKTAGSQNFPKKNLTDSQNYAIIRYNKGERYGFKPASVSINGVFLDVTHVLLRNDRFGAVRSAFIGYGYLKT
jgi:hypothetical protein